MKYLLVTLFMVGCGNEMGGKSYNEVIGDYCAKNLEKANKLLDEGDMRRYELAECIVFSGDCKFKCYTKDMESCNKAAKLQESKCRLVN